MGWLKILLQLLMKLLYRVEVRHSERLAAAGDRILIVANHTSFIDGLLLATFLPGRLTFAINARIASRNLLKPFLALAKIFPMEPTNPLSTKSLIRHLQKNERAVIFPEGRITVTGSLMKIYDGTGLIAIRSGAAVIPIRIDGAQYTVFSRMRGRLRLRWFPKITLTVLEPRNLVPPADVHGRARRKMAGKLLSDLMTEMMFQTSHTRSTLFEELLDARRIHGSDHHIVEDIQRNPLSYRQLITRAFVLGKAICEGSDPGDYVGLLLPSMTGTVTAFFGLHAYGRVPAMLNYTVGSQGMISACRTAQINTVVTSRRFSDAAKLNEVIAQLSKEVRVVYLEDILPQIGWLQRITGLISAQFPHWASRANGASRNPDDPAVVLFTSGTEGAPKGVVLSHANLLANRSQIAARVDFSPQDRILNALPLFHSFGLTAGTLLPLFSGMKIFFYPSPLHYRIVPEIAYDINATILFGTNTFLAGYARFAHPYDFYSVRYVFAGAEKLQDETRRIWSEKFGVRIFEGYGATETSPVLSANTPMENAVGSVGRLMPGMEYRLAPVDGIAAGGRLHVRGPNVMRGYLLADNPGVLVPPRSEFGDDWYDTGDIVSIDARGFLRILGRAKRFAKVGGEMVSLAAVEELVASVWPEGTHAVIALPDRKKGEQLILITDVQEADRPALIQAAKPAGVSEINLPGKIIKVKQVPLLGSGKIDYNAVRVLAEKSVSPPSNET